MMQWLCQHLDAVVSGQNICLKCWLLAFSSASWDTHLARPMPALALAFLSLMQETQLGFWTPDMSVVQTWCCEPGDDSTPPSVSLTFKYNENK